MNDELDKAAGGAIPNNLRDAVDYSDAIAVAYAFFFTNLSDILAEPETLESLAKQAGVPPARVLTLRNLLHRSLHAKKE